MSERLTLVHLLPGHCRLPVYYTNRSQCWFKLKNFESALNDATEAVKLDPSFGKGYLRVASCCTVYGDFEKARRCLEQALPLLDSKGQAEVAREKARLDVVCKNALELERCWEKQDWRAAVYFATQVAEVAPQMPSVFARKAEALVYCKKVEDALNLMADVLRRDDKNVDAIYVRG